MGTITIHPPELSFVENAARVSCVIDENATPSTVTFDVEREWGQYLVTENVDAYLIALLPYAMRNGADIRLLAPVSADLLHNIEMYLVPHLVRYDNLLFPTRIHAQSLQYEGPGTAGAVGTGMSMGVDSFFTVAEYLDPSYAHLRLTHLFVEQVGDLVEHQLSSRHKRNVNERTIDEVARSLELPVVYAYSNIRQVFRIKHYFTHTYTSMFFVHMLSKLFGTYFYSSTEDFAYFDLTDNSMHDAAKHELLSLQVLSTASLKLLSGGASSTRVEKTAALAEFPQAREHLRVCLSEEMNCMVCWKCRRTLLTLDMLGKLGDFEAVFDLPRYQEHRAEYVAWLVKTFHEDPDGVSIRELHATFTEREPEAVSQVEAQYTETQNVGFQPMKRPRRLRLIQDLTKVNPFYPEQLYGTVEVVGAPLKAGSKILFTDVVTVLGRKYLRSRHDSIDEVDAAIPFELLTETKVARDQAR